MNNELVRLPTFENKNRKTKEKTSQAKIFQKIEIYGINWRKKLIKKFNY